MGVKAGDIKIRIGDGEPCVVYVAGFNKEFNWWVCDKINTTETLFSNHKDLIDFDPKKLRILYCKWKIKLASRIKKNYAQELKELK